MLGVGDFYYELGVQIIEVCLALKHRNGGKFCHFIVTQLLYCILSIKQAYIDGSIILCGKTNALL